MRSNYFYQQQQKCFCSLCTHIRYIAQWCNNEFLQLRGLLPLGTQKLYPQGARRLKLRNIPECATMSGGQAIEHLAVRGDPRAFEFPTPMWKYRDCTFSFSGLKNAVKSITEKLEKQYGKCSQSIL